MLESRGDGSSLFRLRLSKGPEARYISHLDLKRALERALRRAEVPVAYSSGYNPHMKISFAPALGVGLTSEGELLDVQLRAPVSPGDLVARLNAQLPPGLAVLSAREVTGGGPSLAEAVEWASYHLDLVSRPGEPPPDWRALVRELLGRETIVSRRVSHDGKIRSVDARALIHRVEVAEVRGAYARLLAIMRAGAGGNLRPEELVTALGILQGGNSLELSSAHRLELMAAGENGPVPLDDAMARKE